MKKKALALVFAIVIVAALCVGLVACNNGSSDDEIVLPAYENIESVDYSELTIPANFKVGMICLHDNSSTYDKNFIDAMYRAVDELGLSRSQLIIKMNVFEDARCTTAATQLVEAGCNVIFADSFGHEKFLVPVAKANPNVQFCHATGVSEHSSSSLPNLHNAFASIYEGRYLAGVAAGMKLNEMIKAGEFTAEEAKMGYVGAYTYAEVISGYTAFYLGAKSVCPTVTMDVQFTGSWFSLAAEKTAAQTLIAGGCKLISQHADSTGAPSACEEKGVPNVAYNGSTVTSCPETFIVSSSINWTPYLKHMIAQVATGNAIKANYTGSIKDGSVILTNIGKNASAEGTVEAIVAARKKLVSGELYVFDCANFTVNGKHLTTYMADTDGDYAADTEAIFDLGDGHYVFKESYHRSAPYFDLRIDGITLKNEAM